MTRIEGGPGDGPGRRRHEIWVEVGLIANPRGPAGSCKIELVRRILVEGYGRGHGAPAEPLRCDGCGGRNLMARWHARRDLRPRIAGVAAAQREVIEEACARLRWCATGVE